MRQENQLDFVDLEQLPGGVLLVRFSGLLTTAGIMACKRRVLGSCAGVRSFVVDYSGAVVALTGQQLDAVLEGEQLGSRASLPAAMIAAPVYFDLFKGHALRMASRGIIRRVFSSRQAAVVWAGQHRAQ